MPDLARWQRALGHELTIIPVSSGDPTADSRAMAAEHGLSPVLSAPDTGVSDAYAVAATPAAIAIDSDARIASLPAVGAPAIEAPVRVTLRQHERHNATANHASIRG